MTIEDALREAMRLLVKASIFEPRRDASVLLVHVLGGDREILFREPEKELLPHQYAQYVKYIERRSKREPVSHIVQQREFWSRDFLVNKHVLDPRPDSETLIDAVLQQARLQKTPDTILDLGTGSGCLLLTLLAELNNSHGIGVDISEEALSVAMKNAENLGLADRTKFLQSSWFDKVSGQYDMIISNPPYIERDDIEQLQPEVREYEPRLALDGGEDGLACYRYIIPRLSRFLNPGGFAIFEVGEGQAEQVLTLLQEAHFVSLRIHNDLASIGRCVSGIMEN